MTSVLTDRAALNRYRRRAARQPVDFLHLTARDELEDRLSLVNKPFTDTAVITGHPDLWKDFRPGAALLADDEMLALEPGTMDLVIHAMCLHWANDTVGQLVQARRALRPDGLFLAVLPGGETLQELRLSLAEAEAEVTGGLSPRVAPMGEIRDLGALLQRAGFALPVADSLPLKASYASPLHLMQELRGMGEGNALNDRLRHPTRRSVILRGADIYQTRYSEPSGRVQATFELIFLTGWCPDASQQKPLRPGSAVARLADALGTDETSLND